MSTLIQIVWTLKGHSTVKENINNSELEKLDKNSENIKNMKRKSSIKNYVKPKEHLSQNIKSQNNTNDKNSSIGFRKGKTKYILNLLNDTSIKKYKQSCISFLKEDTLIKNLYEENGFEKTNFSYDNFLEKNFFNNKLFLYKLEIMLTNEDFVKKIQKINFLKKK